MYIDIDTIGYFNYMSELEQKEIEKNTVRCNYIGCGGYPPKPDNEIQSGTIPDVCPLHQNPLKH